MFRVSLLCHKAKRFMLHLCFELWRYRRWIGGENCFGVSGCILDYSTYLSDRIHVRDYWHELMCSCGLKDASLKIENFAPWLWRTGFYGSNQFGLVSRFTLNLQKCINFLLIWLKGKSEKSNLLKQDKVKVRVNVFVHSI